MTEVQSSVLFDTYLGTTPFRVPLCKSHCPYCNLSGVSAVVHLSVLTVETAHSIYFYYIHILIYFWMLSFLYSELTVRLILTASVCANLPPSSRLSE